MPSLISREEDNICLQITKNPSRWHTHFTVKCKIYMLLHAIFPRELERVGCLENFYVALGGIPGVWNMYAEGNMHLLMTLWGAIMYLLFVYTFFHPGHTTFITVLLYSLHSISYIALLLHS
uniref:Uncharacterized protein n=1 Tax=Cacopsylla melanoneura TaxID=428564 RepID=A0A8D9EB99_9HEMI